MKSTINSVLQNAKLIYKESIQSNNETIEELALSIITDIKILQNNKEISKPRERITFNDEKSKDINILAYVFSEYEHSSLFPNDNQSDAIKKISGLFNVKYDTFRLKRDYYDSFTSSKRKGWKKELSDSLREVFDELRILPKDEVLNIAKTIMKRYENR